MTHFLRFLSLTWLPGLVLISLAGCSQPASPPRASGSSAGYLFCFWNTENFFDQERNGWKNEPDRDYDTWFAEDRAAYREKLDHLREVLLKMNDGKGPDILALAEVETEQAVEGLRDGLNQCLDAELHYQTILWKNPHGGRHIATAILTRLPAVKDRTRLLHPPLRILEGHLEVNGHDLVIIASHWTSRVSDKTGKHRDKYGDQIYGRFRAIYEQNPQVDLLVCGDFNDNPDDASVTDHLHALSDLARVQAGGPKPLLYNLFGGIWETNNGHVGSHFYRGHNFIFDQIAVSPGLLDADGWECEVASTRIVQDQFQDAKGHPLRFGSRKDQHKRGASDHFPVTVRLKVE